MEIDFMAYLLGLRTETLNDLILVLKVQSNQVSPNHLTR